MVTSQTQFGYLSEDIFYKNFVMSLKFETSYFSRFFEMFYSLKSEKNENFAFDGYFTNHFLTFNGRDFV